MHFITKLFSPPAIAIVALVGIGGHLLLRFGGTPQPLTESSTLLWSDLPLLVVFGWGGVPLVGQLLLKALRREFGSDLLAGISIVTAALLGEYLAGTLVVLMLSGGETLEQYAVGRASSVLSALAKRVPAVAHRKRNGQLDDIPLAEVAVGDELVVFPHEICPVDGTVEEGHGQMDESYLTGEPYVLSKAPGSQVLSGAINGTSALTIRVDRQAIDSRYAKIMRIMRESEQRRPRLRRMADQLGAVYTPIAVVLALAAWGWSGSADRFLAVLVVATPCPLLIAIPVAIIGSISLSARHGIIVKDPAVMEKINACRVAIFDKTGTLTYGEPRLVGVFAVGKTENELLRLVASLERYSKHPLAVAVLRAARERNLPLADATQVSERPGAGLTGLVDGRSIRVTHRRAVAADHPEWVSQMPPPAGGLECVLVIDDAYAGILQFRDAPRGDGAPFIRHLGHRHGISRIMLVSGDRESEVRYLADLVGIQEVFASQTPEQKLTLVREETRRAPTLFMGDGINDAPALTAATVGIAFGQNSDITSEAAGAVIMDSSLRKVDQFLHISQRMKRIALQSAVGGMIASVVGMGFAAGGWLPPVAGALVQELIDVLAVVNALRVGWVPASLTDYDSPATADDESKSSANAR